MIVSYVIFHSTCDISRPTDQLRARPESKRNSSSSKIARRTWTCTEWPRTATLVVIHHKLLSKRCWVWYQCQRLPETQRTAECRPVIDAGSTTAPPTPWCCRLIRWRRWSIEQRQWRTSSSGHPTSLSIQSPTSMLFQLNSRHSSLQKCSRLQTTDNPWRSS